MAPRSGPTGAKASRFNSGWALARLPAGVAAVWGAVLLWPWASHALGFGPTAIFFDLLGSLAAGEAQVRGLDPYAINPLDPYGRPHLYSSWWLISGDLGLTRADVTWVGAGILLAVLMAATAAWRPRAGREQLLAAAILVSPAWLFAVYRANNDLVIFIGVAVLVSALTRKAQLWRIVAGVLAGGLAILKYFPAAALLAVLTARTRREMLVMLGAAAGVVMLGWRSIESGLAAAANYGSQASGLTAFGLTHLGAALPAGTPAPVGWLLATAAGWLGFRVMAIVRQKRPAVATAERENRAMAAVLAAALTALCFLIGSSYNYKLIFLWWLAPWLLRDAPDVLGRARANALLTLLLLECWIDGATLALTNVLGPFWDHPQRVAVLKIKDGISMITQLGCWVLIGACCGLAYSWTRQQLARLARVES